MSTERADLLTAPFVDTFVHGTIGGAQAIYNLGSDNYSNVAIGTSWPNLQPGVVGANQSAPCQTNTAYGSGAMTAETTGQAQTAVGYQALNAMENGKGNIAVGHQAMGSASGGDRNVAIGVYALRALTGGLYPSTSNGTFNTAVGDSAMISLSTGYTNTGFGSAVMQYLETGHHNVAIGDSALWAGGGSGSAGQKGVSFNHAIGNSSLQKIATDGNTALGEQVLQNSTGAAANLVGVGFQAGIVNTTGANLTLVGHQAAASATTGSDNTVVGYQGLLAGGAGGSNTVIGSGAAVNATGAGTVALGFQTLRNVVTASNNTAIGYQALYSATSGQNAGVGWSALINTSTGAGNTAIGYSAGSANATGAANTYLGRDAGNTDGTTATAAALTNTTLIGYQAQATDSNVIVLGSAISANRPNLSFGAVGAAANFGAGVGVFFIADAATNPNANPTGGGVLYVDAGALKYRGSTGTVTTIAAA